MIVNQERNNIIRSDNFSEKKFTIASSPKAFQILSKSLYSDSILAIVRETSTNALDSHVAAGKSDIPFEVHLPNVLEPYLEFKDFGVGLSEKDMHEIYTSYFTSTKTNSNSFVGQLGLGSKVGFSYSDSFSVVSRFNGVKYCYTAFVDEEGFPALNLMDKQPTTEVNGLTINIPVKTADFYKFKEAAEKVYKWYDVKPKVTGQTINMNRDKPKIVESDFELTQGGYYSVNHLLMGSVVYPVDLSFMSTKKNFLNHYSVLFKVGIGDVDVTASRESLEMTQKTKDKITSLINKIDSKILSIIEKEISSQKTWWEACLVGQQHVSMIGTIDKLKWNGTPLASKVSVPQAKFQRINLNYNNKITIREVYSIDVNSTVEIIVDDLKAGGMLRARQYLKNHKNGRVAHLYVLSETEFAELAKILTSYPTSLLTKTSALDKIQRTPAKQLPKVFEFVKGSYRIKDAWVESKVDITKGNEIYVELDGYHPKEKSCEWLNYILDLLGKIGYTPKIYGIKTKELPNVSPKWTLLSEYLKDVAIKEKDLFSLSVSLDNYLKYKNLVNSASIFTCNDIAKVVGDIKKCTANEQRLRAAKKFVEYNNLNKDFKEVTIDDKIKDVKKKYPLVFHIIENCYANMPVKDMAYYVELIDKN